MNTENIQVWLGIFSIETYIPQVTIAKTGAQSAENQSIKQEAHNATSSRGLPVVFNHPQSGDYKRWTNFDNSQTEGYKKGTLKATGVDISTAESSQNRRDIIDSIQSKIQSPANTTATQLESSQAQFQKYLDTYASIQANISALACPVIKDIITNHTDNVTNSTWIHDVAMGAYVEIVGLPVTISGPFVAGMNYLGWLEKQYFNGTNNTVAIIAAKSKYTDDDKDTLRYFATYEKLFYVYENAWKNGTAAANSTGLLTVSREVRRRLATKNTLIMPKNFLENVNRNLIEELFLGSENFTIL